MGKQPPPPAAGLPESADAFTDEIKAAVPDRVDWGPVTGETQAIGHPPERYDLIPNEPLEQLAILFGKREGEKTNPIDLRNHAEGCLRRAMRASGPTRRHYLVEAARACIILADQ